MDFYRNAYKHMEFLGEFSLEMLFFLSFILEFLVVMNCFRGDFWAAELVFPEKTWPSSAFRVSSWGYYPEIIHL